VCLGFFFFFFFFFRVANVATVYPKTSFDYYGKPNKPTRRGEGFEYAITTKDRLYKLGPHY
jgi:hypothetical protein